MDTKVTGKAKHFLIGSKPIPQEEMQCFYSISSQTTVITEMECLSSVVIVELKHNQNQLGGEKSLCDLLFHVTQPITKTQDTLNEAETMEKFYFLPLTWSVTLFI